MGSAVPWPCDMRSEPFALSLYRRRQDGETVEEMASGLGIPEERIERRLRAAAEFYARQTTRVELGALARAVERGE